MNKLHENRIGETHINNNGDKLTIVNYKGNSRYLIKKVIKYIHLKLVVLFHKKLICYL